MFARNGPKMTSRGPPRGAAGALQGPPHMRLQVRFLLQERAKQFFFGSGRLRRRFWELIGATLLDHECRHASGLPKETSGDPFWSQCWLFCCCFGGALLGADVAQFWGPISSGLLFEWSSFRAPRAHRAHAKFIVNYNEFQ